MIISNEKDLKALREGGKRLAFILDEIAKSARPGVATSELDALAQRLIQEGDDKPAFLNYQPDGASTPFPATLCTSINNEIVHGIPLPTRILKDGDIVGLDLGLSHKGFYVDAALTVPVGKIDAAAKELILVTRKALARAIKAVRAGTSIGDIGATIEKFVAPWGYGIVRELGGHGLGKSVHEKPYVPNFGKKGTGPKLVAGEVIALEPMLNEGSPDIVLADDGYTYKTTDGKRSAHFEHTIVVTQRGAEILTNV